MGGGSVVGRFIEADAGDVAVDRGGQTEADIDRRTVVDIDVIGRGVAKKSQGGVGGIHGEGDAGAGGFGVQAVVGGPAQNVNGAGDARRPGVSPVGGAGGRMPGGAAIGGNFHAGDHAAAVIHRRAGDRDRNAAGERLPGNREGDRGLGRGDIGGFRRVDEIGLQAAGLNAHVGKNVDGGLLDVDIGGGGEAGVRAVEAPGPLHRAGAEHERSAGGAVHGGVAGVGAVIDDAAVVEERASSTEAVVLERSTSPAGR